MLTKTKKPARKPAKRKSKTAADIEVIGGTTDDPRQTFIEGAEPLMIPELDKAVGRFGDLTTTRKKQKEMADEELNKIVAIMKEHGLDKYKSNGKIVTVIEGQTVCKIKNASDK